MKKLRNKKLHWALFVLSSFLLMSHVAADETVIKQEKLSFEKCLKVITTSEDKLSIAPKIEEVSDLKRVAVFILIDGTLTITCDGQEGNVTVSTNTD